MRKKEKCFMVLMVIVVMACVCVGCLVNSLQQENTLVENAKDGNEVIASEVDVIEFSILGSAVLKINRERFGETEVGQINNRWELEEVDLILDSIQGKWQVDKYAGFVPSSLYYPDLFEEQENFSEEQRNELLSSYNESVEEAKMVIPNIFFSVREKHERKSNANTIYANGYYDSPINILMSLEHENDCYPAFVDRTAISDDFVVEYPVLYIQFFYVNDMDGEKQYEPATLVISADEKFYLLVNGAYYTLKKV